MKKSTSKKIFSALVCVGILLMMCMNAFAAEVVGVDVKTTTDGEVTVTGTISGNAQVESTILVTTGADLENVQDSDIAYIDQVTTAADGTFSYQFKVEAASEDQEFKLYLGGTNVAQVFSKPFNLNETVEPTGYKITGTVKLMAATEAAANGLQVVAKKVVEEGEPVEYFGEYSIVDNKVVFEVVVDEAGTYKLVFERQGYLKRVVGEIVIEDEDYEVEDEIRLLAGDIKGDGTTTRDGSINSHDLVGIINVYDSMTGDEKYVEDYDIDADTKIGSAELVQIISNYDSVDDVE